MAPFPVCSCIFATLGSLGGVLALGTPFIKQLKAWSFGQYIREDGPQHHQGKAGTPTGGGILILLGLMLGTLLLVMFEKYDLLSPRYWVCLLVTLGLGILGAIDDGLKIFKKHNKGVNGYTKLLVQGFLGAVVGLLAYQQNGGIIPIFGGYEIILNQGSGIAMAAFGALSVMAVSNAVNLTDGLDGLAAGTAFCSFVSLAVITGFLLPTVHLDLLVFCLISAGAVGGFYLLNRHPAKLFMGDTGSLALGGAMAAVALLANRPFVLLLVGGLFLVETLSVILQVASFKFTGKRLFKMSPLHHHFELSGWPETKVVTVFTVFHAILCVVAALLFLHW